jgi:hypothetical protein
MHLHIVAFVLTVAGSVLGATTCNGAAELCSRKYSNVSQIGSHDSAFVGSFVTDNQDESVTNQLDAGIRFLQGQVGEDFHISLMIDQMNDFIYGLEVFSD